jgi:8-oxo-dGTP pyrophosphatase MutT (NUDIX family)
MKRTNRRFKKTKRRKKLQSGGSWGDNFFNNLIEISKQSGDIKPDFTVKNTYKAAGIYPYQASKGGNRSRLLVIKSRSKNGQERWSTPGGRIDRLPPPVKHQTIFGEILIKHPMDRGDRKEYSVVAAIRECIEETGISPITDNYNLDNIEWNGLEYDSPTFKFPFRIPKSTFNRVWKNRKSKTESLEYAFAKLDAANEIILTDFNGSIKRSGKINWRFHRQWMNIKKFLENN